MNRWVDATATSPRSSAQKAGTLTLIAGVAMVPDESRELSAKPLIIPEIIDFPTEVDISNIDDLEGVLLASVRRGVAVVIADLSRTRFCDGAGVRSLLAAHDEADAHGAELRLVIPSSAVRRLFVLLGGDTRVRVYPDMKAGLAGAPGTAPRSGPDDFAGTTRGISERCQAALRAARQVAERLDITKDILRRPQPAPNDTLLRTSEFARLFLQVSTMPVIEQAKGILMYYEHCGADEAFDMLRRASQRSNVPVRQIAAQIVERTSS